jgi:hypothetical protein
MSDTKNPSKAYLGDGVYVEDLKDGSIMLTTEHGGTVADNTIYMEMKTYDALVRWVGSKIEKGKLG